MEIRFLLGNRSRRALTILSRARLRVNANWLMINESISLASNREVLPLSWIDLRNPRQII